MPSGILFIHAVKVLLRGLWSRQASKANSPVNEPPETPTMPRRQAFRFLPMFLRFDISHPQISPQLPLPFLTQKSSCILAYSFTSFRNPAVPGPVPAAVETQEGPSQSPAAASAVPQALRTQAASLLAAGSPAAAQSPGGGSLAVLRTLPGSAAGVAGVPRAGEARGR